MVDAVPLWAGDDRCHRSQVKPDIGVIDEPPKLEHQEKGDEVGCMWTENDRTGR